MLKVQHLQCCPPGEAPVRDVSFVVQVGELVTLAGPNGSGKATLASCLAGLRARDAGRVSLDDEELPSAPWEIAAAGVAVLLKGRRVFADLTVQENLAVGILPSRRSQAGAGMPARSVSEVLSLFPQLMQRLHQSAGTLSGGEQQMLAISRALLRSPRFLILEEPSFGIAPRVYEVLLAALVAVSARACGVLILDEEVGRTRAAAARIYQLREGRIVT